MLIRFLRVSLFGLSLALMAPGVSNYAKAQAAPKAAKTDKPTKAGKDKKTKKDKSATKGTKSSKGTKTAKTKKPKKEKKPKKALNCRFGMSKKPGRCNCGEGDLKRDKATDRCLYNRKGAKKHVKGQPHKAKPAVQTKDVKAKGPEAIKKEIKKLNLESKKHKKESKKLKNMAKKLQKKLNKAKTTKAKKGKVGSNLDLIFGARAKLAMADINEDTFSRSDVLLAQGDVSVEDLAKLDQEIAKLEKAIAELEKSAAQVEKQAATEEAMIQAWEADDEAKLQELADQVAADEAEYYILLDPALADVDSMASDPAYAEDPDFRELLSDSEFMADEAAGIDYDEYTDSDFEEVALEEADELEEMGYEEEEASEEAEMALEEKDDDAADAADDAADAADDAADAADDAADAADDAADAADDAADEAADEPADEAADDGAGDE